MAADAGDVVEVWRLIAERLNAIDEYVDLFRDAYPGDVQAAGDITYAHAANAIAAFEAVAWRADDSPFDRYLRGAKQAMSKSARRGMRLFYGKAGCADCHSGLFQTDQEFHAIAMPQIGPGKGDGASGHEDFGREQVTLDPVDRYRFRTPPLRNVALTAPYGHDGAYDTLEAVVRHHLDPVAALEAYDTSQARLPSDPALDPIDFLVHENSAVRDQIANANELAPQDLSDEQVADLIEFLQALTDPASLDLRRDVPDAVPSGLPLAE
jgi:cytochrome c peroxidase